MTAVWAMNNLPETTEVITYCFDIDGTICTNTEGNYEGAQPFPERIAAVNRLFHNGHRIIYFTARGSTSGLDWRELTETQLSAWGARYHKLILGKPFAHFFIDDRAIHSENFPW
jgi:hypothetical protein